MRRNRLSVNASEAPVDLIETNGFWDASGTDPWFGMNEWKTEEGNEFQILGAAIYTVSQKNVPHLACYNFDAHEWILIFFGRNVTDKVGNQKMLYYATSNNMCFCTTWQNAEHENHTFHSTGLC